MSLCFRDNQFGAFYGRGRGEDDCRDVSVMIQLRAWNGAGVEGHDDCLDVSSMIILRALDGTGG